jgi:hypothetical protein
VDKAEIKEKVMSAIREFRPASRTDPGAICEVHPTGEGEEQRMEVI